MRNRRKTNQNLNTNSSVVLLERNEEKNRCFVYYCYIRYCFGKSLLGVGKSGRRLKKATVP